MNKRINKTIIRPAITQQNDPLEISSGTSVGLNRAILILVEGETELAYFNGLKTLPFINNRFEVRHVGNTLDKMVLEAIREKNNFDRTWFVVDNDKRNAFVLEKSFFDKAERILPPKQFDLLKSATPKDFNLYFLSTYDYINWLSFILGTNSVVEYWDAILKCTPKHSDFEKFDNNNPYSLLQKSILFFDKQKDEFTNIHKQKAKKFDVRWKQHTDIAYSCVAFEFWLLLHFEQNKMPFLLVDKVDDTSIDVIAYFRNEICPGYVKGEKGIGAFSCLKENPLQNSLLIKDKWAIIVKLITAILNTSWLQQEMRPTLEKLNYKWFEVNPYIKGLDILLSNLLNLVLLDTPVSHLGWDSVITFSFDPTIMLLRLNVEFVPEAQILLNDTHKVNFTIINRENIKYNPVSISTAATKNGLIADIQFNIPVNDRSKLVLQFKHPKDNGRVSSIILVPLFY